MKSAFTAGLQEDRGGARRQGDPAEGPVRRRRALESCSCHAPGVVHDLGLSLDDEWNLDGHRQAAALGRVALVGHSIAGDELTGFAAAYPDRVTALADGLH